MAAEEGFDFNTAGTVKQVQNLENALDQLLLMVQKVDKGNLTGLAKEFQQLSTVGVAKVKELAEKAEKELSRIGASGSQTAVTRNLKALMTEMQAYMRTQKLSMELAIEAPKLYGVGSVTQKAKDAQNLADKLFSSTQLPAANMPTKPSRDFLLQMEVDALQAGLQKLEAVSASENAIRKAYQTTSLENGKRLQAVAKANVSDTLASRAAEASALQAGLQKLEAVSASENAIRKAYQTTSLENGKRLQAVAKANVSDTLASRAAEASALQSGLQKLEAASASENAIRKAYQTTSLENGKRQVAVVKKNAADLLTAYEESSRMLAAQRRVDSIFDANQPVRAIAVTPSASATRLLATEAAAAREKLSGMGSSMRSLSADSADLHAGLRGVASGFDAMWLTYGRVLPLIAGAAVSNVTRKVYDTGSEIEYNIKFMEVLGQTTKEQGAVVRQALRDIDQETLFSQKELAEAMVRVGQSGLNVASSLQVVRSSAALATVGMVDLKTSTDLVMQTNNLFGRSSDDAGKTAAQLFVATKEGALNVENLAGSLKSASEVNTGFKKTLSETLVLLTALAKSGIKDSAGGTAFINFLRNVSTPLGPAKKAMADMADQMNKTRAAGEKPWKFTMFKEDGSQKSTIEGIKELQNALNQFKPEQQMQYMERLTNNRGIKLLFAAIREGTVDLEKMLGTIEKASEVDLFKAQKGLMDTTKGAMNLLSGSLVSVFDKVFEVNSGKFKGFIETLDKAVKSESFSLGVYQMVSAVGKLFDVVVAVTPVAVTFLQLWVGYKAITLAQAALGGLAVVLAGLPATFQRATLAAQTMSAVSMGTASSLTASGVAAAGAATSMGLLGRAALILANPVTGLILGLGMLAAAWYTSRDAAKTSLTETTAEAVSKGAVTLKQFDKEIEKLTLLRKLRSQPASPFAALSESVNASQTALDIAKVERDKVAKATPGNTIQAKMQASTLEVLNARIIKSEQELTDKRMALGKANAKIALEEAEDIRKAKEKADADLKALQGTLTGGTPKGSGASTPKSDLEKEQDRIKNKAEAILDTSRRYSEVAAQEAASTANLTAVRRASIQTLSDIKALMDGKTKPSKDDAAMLAQAAANANRAILDDDIQTQQKMYQASVAETKKILDAAAASSRDFWQKDTDAEEKLAAVNAMNIAIKSMSDREVAVYKARVEAVADYDKGLQSLTSELAKAKDSYDTLFGKGELIANSGTLTDLKSRMDKLRQLIQDYEKIAGNRVDDKGLAAGNAFDAAAAAKANGSYGDAATKAMRTYMRNNEDVAAQTEKVFTNAFSNMEDALVKFVTTGKFSFRSLVESILEGLVRIAIQQASSSIFGSLLNLAGSVAGGTFGMSAAGVQASGAVTSGVSGWGAGSAVGTALPPIGFDVGTNYVPYDMMAKIHKGERIVPAASNPYANPYTKDSAEAGQTINVTQNFTVGDVASISTVREAVANSEKRMAAIVQRSKVYGGAYTS